MKLSADEINCLALTIAKVLIEKYDKNDIKIIRKLLYQIINNLNTYND